MGGAFSAVFASNRLEEAAEAEAASGLPADASRETLLL
jgi:hypothetical protein